MDFDINRLRSAYETSRDLLLAERVDGHWVGELSASALSTATAVSALALVRRVEGGSRKADGRSGDTNKLDALIAGGMRYLVALQNIDGGWGDTDKSYSNIATTYLAVAAIHLVGRATEFGDVLARAEQYLDANGRIAGLKKRYGVDKTFVVPILTNCALAGIVPWSEVDALPFELACVPQSWYRFVNMPVVSYAVPALVAIGQAKFFHAPPRNPLLRALRRASVPRSLKVLRQMQPASGGYLEAIPLTSFVVMSLASMLGGSASGDDLTRSVRTTLETDTRSVKPTASFKPSVRTTLEAVLDSGVKFLIESVRPDGSWPIDTNLATWVTTLALNALAGAGEDISKLADLDWLLKCQHTKRHPFTGADPGGWGWSDLSGAVPDADDTPGAMLVLCQWLASATTAVNVRDRVGRPLTDALFWLARLQNRDGGWPTFCRGWSGLPFDRSGTDLTAHVIRAMAAFHRTFKPHSKEFNPPIIRRGFRYIERHQRADGSWLPLWFGNQDHPNEENPIYGTAKVLMAYRDVRRLDTPAAQRGFEYLLNAQNADGGWGGGASIRRQGRTRIGQDGTVLVVESTVEETALAVEALLAFHKQKQRGTGNGERGPGENSSSVVNSEARVSHSLAHGLAWLCNAVENGQLSNPTPIGLYFAKLWYYERLYPLTFTVSALGRAFIGEYPR